jgi:hypothetical protein
MVHREALLYEKMHAIDCIAIAIHSMDDGDDIPSFFDVEVDYVIVVRHHARCPNNCSHPIIGS